MYPKRLPKHSVETFRLEQNAPNNEPLSKAYYHTNDYPINMHSHNFYEINIVVEGVGVHYIENISIPISPGNVFAIPPKSRHGYWAEDDRLKIFHLILPEYIFEKYEHELAQFPGFAFLFEIEPLLRRNSRENFSLYLSEEELARLRPELDNLIYTAEQKEQSEIVELFDLRSILLVCTLSHLINCEYMLPPPTISAEQPQPDSLSIIKTIEYMHKHYAEKLSIDELAAMANMSRSTYLRHFGSLCGQPPTEYLIELRVKRACALLKNGELSITDIAQACGFFDCSHFIRFFTKLRGMTPNTYRKTILTRF